MRKRRSQRESQREWCTRRRESELTFCNHGSHIVHVGCPARDDLDDGTRRDERQTLVDLSGDEVRLICCREWRVGADVRVSLVGARSEKSEDDELELLDLSKKRDGGRETRRVRNGFVLERQACLTAMGGRTAVSETVL